MITYFALCYARHAFILDVYDDERDAFLRERRPRNTLVGEYATPEEAHQAAYDALHVRTLKRLKRLH